MPAFLLKPVHWNPSGYAKPAGHRATSGYPKDHGFGHEEWNGSPSMRFNFGGVWHRAFHTEPVGHAASDASGETTIFMYASHAGSQELVGVAGRATDIRGDECAALRSELRVKIGMADMWTDAWAVPLVRKCHGNSESALRGQWVKTLPESPTWMCPESHYLWLPAGVPLNAAEITGKSKLLGMFSSYTAVTPATAALILDRVPVNLRNQAWRCIRSDIVQPPSDLASEIAAIQTQPGISYTTKSALVEARLGQGKFRAGLMKSWNNKCSVTGCTASEALRASHIKAWSESTNEQRLDTANGLLLTANLDALFDRALISFEDSGHMLVSDTLSSEDRKLLGVPHPLARQLNSREQVYMSEHRQRFHEKNGSAQ